MFRSSDVPPDDPSRSWTPITSKRRPATRIGAAEGLARRKQRLGHVGADHRDLGAAQFLVALDEPAARQPEVPQLGQRRRRAADRRVLVGRPPAVALPTRATVEA